MRLFKYFSIAAVSLVLSMPLTACGDASNSTNVQNSRPTQSSLGIGSSIASSVGTTTPAPDSLTLLQVANVEAPTALSPRPGTSDTYVTSQPGRVYKLEGGAGEAKLALSITSETEQNNEQGLLGIAFSNDGQHMYLNYTDRSGDTQIVEYKLSDNEIVSSSKRILMTIDQPYPNHNGGCIRVMSDDTLLIGMGDGGSAGDPQNRAQSPDSLLGKILRIDPRRPTDSSPYSIPSNNPFINVKGTRPEIYALGVRNPWKFAEDFETGDFWITDVGQNKYEEINRVTESQLAGANFGWALREANDSYKGDKPSNNVDPVAAYDHSRNRCSISGGAVYRGQEIPGLNGQYIYADFCDGVVMRLDPTSYESKSLGAVVPRVSAIEVGTGNELYALANVSGAIYKLTA